MAANDVEHDVKFVFMLGFKRSDEHVELLQILVNNCQRPDFMERLRQAANIEAYFNLVLSMEGIG
jgi:PTS system galactitol-specific IIA component